jgi:hypothetical protein
VASLVTPSSGSRHIWAIVGKLVLLLRLGRRSFPRQSRASIREADGARRPDARVPSSERKARGVRVSL